MFFTLLFAFLHYTSAFNLYNNIHFNTDINLTSLVPNIQNNKVHIIDTHFPYINKETSDYFNNGIPQLANLTDFDYTIEQSIAEYNLTSNYSDLIVFDFEHWTPIWDTLSDVYKNASISYIEQLHPTYNQTRVLDTAISSWETSAMNLFLRAINVARLKLKHAKIGYYGYPGMPYWTNYQRNQLQEYYNNRMFELWANVDVLLPSIYQFYNSTGSFTIALENAYYVYNKLTETNRIKNTFNRDALVYPYTWHRFHDSPNDLISYNEQIIQYQYPYCLHTGIDPYYIDGIVLWGNDNSKQVNETLGWFSNNSQFFEQFT